MSVVDTSMQERTLTQPEQRKVGILHAVAEFLHDFRRSIFDTYHPEAHYMRGPGPACAAKRASRNT